MLRSTLTDRWQTTIPAAVRKALGLKPRQRLVYELRDGGVLIRPESETLLDLEGSLRSDTPPATKAQERAAARAARAGRHT
ncbi:putative regulator PrlF [Pseudobythopirellula maris]|uniref:Putative regulator PrlF n=1 Tax=Pseudobythopirellula maris TaxID=2527991 RepID=A0A5C5ZP06_9BACT|nr:type II toxin-antitoxin system PrlF family antitoxin [Pseudobythopirellula maris]TWT88876.1 putative regulator PrlF [Pseudobythopirellula maris]